MDKRWMGAALLGGLAVVAPGASWAQPVPGSDQPSIMQQEGQPAPATLPLSQTVNPVTVAIGGQTAQVLFKGLTPGYAGLYQINAVVPGGITTGDAVPVVVSVAGQNSPVVTMAVR